MNVGLKFCFVDVVQKSFHVGQSCQFGITPQLFEIIIFPRFGLEDMYIDMTVIDNNPLRVFVSVVVKRFYTDFCNVVSLTESAIAATCAGDPP